MSFIGIVANRKCFENIKREVTENIGKDKINFIQINLRSIENVKNIKFETIIIEDNLDKFEKNKKIIRKICENAQYLMINTDKNEKLNEVPNIENLITYGLNQYANVTISSISDTGILIYCQKSLKSKEGKKIEIEEKRIKKDENKRLKIYEILILDTILKIYQKT